MFYTWYGMDYSLNLGRERAAQQFVGTIKVKGDLDNKEVIKALQKITSKEEPKISY